MLSVLLPAVCWPGIDWVAPPKDRTLVSSISAILLAGTTRTTALELFKCSRAFSVTSAVNRLPSELEAPPCESFEADIGRGRASARFGPGPTQVGTHNRGAAIACGLCSRYLLV